MEQNKKPATRKIGEISEKKSCNHPDHNPPAMIVLEPGFYEYECPACGYIQNFNVNPKPIL